MLCIPGGFSCSRDTKADTGPDLDRLFLHYNLCAGRHHASLRKSKNKIKPLGYQSYEAFVYANAQSAEKPLVLAFADDCPSGRIEAGLDR